MKDLNEMASNKQPHIMCPECFKGTVVMRYTQHDGQCNVCNTNFTLNGMTLKYK
jgi:uncharacterized protein (DUF983 family)